MKLNANFQSKQPDRKQRRQIDEKKQAMGIRD